MLGRDPMMTQTFGIVSTQKKRAGGAAWDDLNSVQHLSFAA